MVHAMASLEVRVYYASAIAEQQLKYHSYTIDNYLKPLSFSLMSHACQNALVSNEMEEVQERVGGGTPG